MKRRLDDGQIEAVDDAVAEVLARKTPAQRIAMIFSCNRTMRLLIEGRLRTLHPEWDEERIAREVAGRMARGTS